MLLADHWLRIASSEKVAIKNYLVNYLMNSNIVQNWTGQHKQVVKMMMLLLAKIAKLAWFDDPDIKNGLVPEVTKILQNANPVHKLIGLQALDQLVVEMTYMTKTKNLSLNRRVSLSFRDAALHDIYANNLQLVKLLAEQFQVDFQSSSGNLGVIIDSLEVCLETYHKCLTFDFVAVLLNETLDEPSQTNVSLPFQVNFYSSNMFSHIAACIMGFTRRKFRNC